MPVNRTSVSSGGQLSNQLLGLTQLTEKLTIKILELEEKLASLDLESKVKDSLIVGQPSDEKDKNLIHEKYFESDLDNENNSFSDSTYLSLDRDEPSKEILETEYIDEPHMPFIE